MGALSLLPSSLVSLQSNPVRASPVRPYLIPRRRVLSHWKGHVTVRANREAERPGGAGGESLFFDENGVVDDMDGYLNYLSLEYDSVWDTKPAWCQPWTILLTGVTVIVCSWLIFHSIVLSSGAFALISAWWYIFLYSYPKAYSEMIAERRRRVSNGMEDTYGQKESYAQDPIMISYLF
ncbi:spindle pole body-associated protein [Rhynchospora pubera]|uniref:Spindle pole body-associated protein n=1 Tax=Rhynchospora pubera TaxID=906938 RepID=A0AAV8HC05_9POAL|nr:spindle pole body-associated protein [Rhynchospora pubera]